MGLNLANKKKVFKEYDIRGIYPEEIDEELVEEVVGVLANKVFGKGKVVVGHDVRNSSPRLYKTAINKLKTIDGVEVVGVGLMTTPMLSFLIQDVGAVGGVCITASHNPKEYNGIKMAKGGECIEVIGGKDIYPLI